MIYKCITPNLGMVSLLAKGVLGKKSTSKSPLSLYNRYQIVYTAPKNVDQLLIIKETQLSESWSSIQSELEKQALVQAMLECIYRYHKASEDSHPIYFFLVHYLQEVNSTESPILKSSTLVHFFLDFLELLGVGPILNLCARCHERLPTLKSLRFHIESGGLLCEDCSQNPKEGVPLNPYWTYTLRSSGLPLPNLQPISPLPKEISELELLLNQFLSHHMGRQDILNSLRFLHNLRFQSIS